MKNITRTATIDWEAELDAWRESGLPLARFCREQGLVSHQLSYYKRKHESKTLSTDTPTPGFTQIAIVKPDTTGTEGLSVRLANGHAIEGISSHTLPLVSALMRSLS